MLPFGLCGACLCQRMYVCVYTGMYVCMYVCVCVHTTLTGMRQTDRQVAGRKTHRGEANTRHIQPAVAWGMCVFCLYLYCHSPTA
mmetsp:Transcript_6097/g.17456  ORF Transcript_6097/g.17456 Transcript_6097/m.17456 type:complete len:85 (+) Transcript_6097:1550-1804(+)